MAHTAKELLTLIVRDAEQSGKPDDTVYSIGWWTKVPEEELGPFNLPSFNARLKLTLAEIREAIKDPPCS